MSFIALPFLAASSYSEFSGCNQWLENYFPCWRGMFSGREL